MERATCFVLGCTKKPKAKNLCANHYARLRAGKDLVPRVKRCVTNQGYVKLGAHALPPWFSDMFKSAGGGQRSMYVLEHRYVMAETLGRPLETDEQVHHRNGRRDDNRAENLELRTGPHGSGATHNHCPTCTCGG